MMKANPGGQIDLNEMVGREQLIADIWDTLAQQSIRLVAERRIGKTTVMKKLHQQPKPNWVTLYQDLEKCHTALDFAYAVYAEVAPLLSNSKKATRKASELLKSLGGIEVAGLFKLPENTQPVAWKNLLCHTIEDLVTAQHEQQQYTLLLWDELPYMLSSIKSREGEAVAMEVLDTLRSLRQTYAEQGLRMVLTGSIGLHHVLSQLKQHNYANAPVNDTYAMQTPPLSMAHAIELAEKLLRGEAITCADGTAAAIAQQSDQFPFYIHHIVKALKFSSLSGTPANVEKIVSTQLTAENDPWELQHYQDRIEEYYGSVQRPTVVAILDSLAFADQPMPVTQLLNELKSSGIETERDHLLQLLRLITQDHYLSRNDDGHYLFQFPLLKRWWKLSRGL